jgi:hypothetical protein
MRGVSMLTPIHTAVMHRRHVLHLFRAELGMIIVPMPKDLLEDNTLATQMASDSVIDHGFAVRARDLFVAIVVSTSQMLFKLESRVHLPWIFCS